MNKHLPFLIVLLGFGLVGCDGIDKSTELKQSNQNSSLNEPSDNKSSTYNWTIDKDCSEYINNKDYDGWGKCRANQSREDLDKKNVAHVRNCSKEFPNNTALFLECINPPKSSSNIPSDSRDKKGLASSLNKVPEIICNGELIDKERNVYSINHGNGDMYVGKLNSRCEYHGPGKYLFSNGTSFEGNYLNGRRVNGNEYYNNGDSREGMSFKNDKLHGSSLYRFSNGIVTRETYQDGRLILNVTLNAPPLPSSQYSYSRDNRQGLTRLAQCLRRGSSGNSCSLGQYMGYEDFPIVTKCEGKWFAGRYEQTCESK
jgi:hypothetical protein